MRASPSDQGGQPGHISDRKFEGGILTQPRRPAGTPNGGQFSAALIHPEAGPIDFRDLISDDEHNETGDYEYPPEVRSATQLIAFWMTVPIPRTVMHQVQRAHDIDRKLFGPNGRERKSLYARKATDTRSDVTIPPEFLRSVVRMTALHQEAGLLSPEDADSVRNQQFTFDNGVTSTPKAIVEYYQMDRILDSLVPGYVHDLDREGEWFDARS
jgi:hypothetical protein